ncbi:uncharacterized protein LOC108622403 [Ceratina calcarata]|uniref:Uncharacterized protein LOC108622403 n=1 Tax=Ceratina calcarata TaxID=156304 RepID=A0AAJ7ISS0_9HYME|nr:uncharacterized protein LOC108622403 [Ceratina calcarata]
MGKMEHIVAYITGAANGIGKAVAEKIVGHGGKVILADTSCKASKMAESMGDKAVFVCVDVRLEQDIKESIKCAKDKFGGVNVLVNSAGILAHEYLYDFKEKKPHSVENFKNQFDVNVWGTFNVTRLMVGLMAENKPDANNQKGVVINLASTMAFEPPGHMVVYGSTKSAIVGMTVPMARGLASQGIRVVCVCPGYIKTPMIDVIDQEEKKKIISMKLTPKRLGKSEEIAHLVKACIENPIINAENIRIDMGYRFCQHIVAYITGAANGIGKAVAEKIVGHGGKVILADTSCKASKMAESMGDKAVFVCVDVRLEQDIKESIKCAKDKFGGVNVLVNSAGILAHEYLYDFKEKKPHSVENFKNQFDVNVWGTFNVTRLMVGLMAENKPDANNQKGVVINLASTMAFEPPGHMVVYGSTKSAIVGMTVPMARGLASQGIRVVCVCPGYIKTPMIDVIDQEEKKKIISMKLTPKRLGKSEEIAHLVKACIENPIINAENIRIDMGYRFCQADEFWKDMKKDKSKNNVLTVNKVVSSPNTNG